MQRKKESFRVMVLSTIEFHAGTVAVNLRLRQRRGIFQFVKTSTVEQIKKLCFKRFDLYKMIKLNFRYLILFLTV